MSNNNYPANLSQQSSEMVTAITDPSTKKRPSSNDINPATNNEIRLISNATQNMEVVEQYAETLANSDTSSGSITLVTDPTVTLTEISWSKINQLRILLRQHELASLHCQLFSSSLLRLSGRFCRWNSNSLRMDAHASKFIPHSVRHLDVHQISGGLLD